MGRIGVSITKSTSFRGATQEFSNVYYFDLDIGFPSAAEADNLIDNLVTKEKAFHSTLVTFVRGRVWSQVGTPSQNEMITQKNLSGTGSSATFSGFDKERAWLFRLRAGVDVRGNPVYFRKWYHTCGNFGSVTPSTGNMDQTAAIASASKTTMEALVDAFRTITVGATVYQLVAKSGRQPTSGETFKSHNYLEHHQLGDQWRAQ